MEDEIELMAKRLNISPRRLNSIKEAPKELLQLPFLKKVSLEERSSTLKRCMSILSNRSRSEVADVASSNGAIDMKKSLLELPTFDTDHSFVLHTSILSHKFDTSCVEQDADNEESRPILTEPPAVQPKLVKQYCKCTPHQPAFLTKMAGLVSNMFSVLS